MPEIEERPHATPPEDPREASLNTLAIVAFIVTLVSLWAFVSLQHGESSAAIFMITAFVSPLLGTASLNVMRNNPQHLHGIWLALFSAICWPLLMVYLLCCKPYMFDAGNRMLEQIQIALWLLCCFLLVNGVILLRRAQRVKNTIRGFWFVLPQIIIPLLILSSFLMPVFKGARKGRHSNCPSYVRQISTAVQMYVQDNGNTYPGIDGDTSWVSKVTPYLGNSAAMFHCRLDEVAGTPTSYGYSNLLLLPDGRGIKSNGVLSPSEVGVVCDAAPSPQYPAGGVLYGAGMHPEVPAVRPAPRHNDVVVVGFCDGHAKFYRTPVRARDLSDGATRALVTVSALGLVDNPAAGVPDFTPTGTSTARFAIGGEYCLSPLLRGAAQVWAFKTGALYDPRHDFTGQDATAKRGADFAWGIGDGVKPDGQAVAVARDAVVVIVSKFSKISALGGETNGSRLVDYPTLRALFSGSSTQASATVYTFDTRSGTRRFLTRQLGEDGAPLRITAGATIVANDVQMVEAVAGDPYGIGYCSSAFADIDRITILALKTPDGHIHYFPRKGPEGRWVLPYRLDWPLARTLYVQLGGKAAGPSSFGAEMLPPASPGMTALRHGPLFNTGYYRP